MIEKFCTAPGSLREQTLEVLMAIEKQRPVTMATEIISKRPIRDKGATDKKYFEAIRKPFSDVAIILRAAKSSLVHIEAFCDIL